MQNFIVKINKKERRKLCKRTKSEKKVFSLKFSLIPTQKNGIIIYDSWRYCEWIHGDTVNGCIKQGGILT